MPRFNDVHIEHLEHGSDEMRVRISNTRGGRDFFFYVNAPHVVARGEILPGEPESKVNQLDWYTELTQHERALALNAINAFYREESEGVDGIKGAAIAVLEREEAGILPADSHPMFLGVNSRATANDYDKVCAEQMALSSVDTALDQEARRGRVVNEKSYKPIACTCGKCIDMLAKRMGPEGQVMVFPDNNGHANLRVNARVKAMEDIRPGEIWLTDIETLNSLRHIKLEPDYAQLQRNGLRQTLQNIRLRHALGNDAPFGNADVKHRLEQGLALLAKDDSGSLNTQETYEKNVLTRMLENHARRQFSVPELDAAVRGGVVDAEILNCYLHGMIEDTLFDRLEKADAMGKIDLKNDSDDSLLAWCEKQIDSIRAVALQFDDNRFYVSATSESLIDNAYPPAGVSAIGSAMRQLGRHGMVHLYTCEMNPCAIADGMMPTSSKQEIERGNKRRTRDAARGSPQVTAIPYNDQSLSPQETQEMFSDFSFSMRRIYGGAFAGGQHLAQLIKDAARPRAQEKS
jgi:cytidine deaminase